MGKEDVKLSLFTEDMIVYTENPKDPPKELLDLIREFGKTEGYKVNILESKALLYNNTKFRNKNMGKNPIYCSNKKNKVHRYKPNKGGKRPVLRKLYNTEERN